jgi:hypothetical protein
MEHPREDLIRMTVIEAAELRDTSGDGNTLVGYPIVFNRWTEISGWEGNFLERIDPAAVKKTLQERSDQVKVLFNHGFDPQIGDKPLGKPALIEGRDYGLWTETPLADTSYNKDLKELLRVGAIDGMSFRFTVMRENWDDEPKPSTDNPKGLPERTIQELRLYEYGPVTFPAYEATTAGIRAREAFQVWRTSHQPAEPTIEIIDSDTPPDRAPVTVQDAPPLVAPVSDRSKIWLRKADRFDLIVEHTARRLNKYER